MVLIKPHWAVRPRCVRLLCVGGRKAQLRLVRGIKTPQQVDDGFWSDANGARDTEKHISTFRRVCVVVLLQSTNSLTGPANKPNKVSHSFLFCLKPLDDGNFLLELPTPMLCIVMSCTPSPVTMAGLIAKTPDLIYVAITFVISSYS